MKHSREEMLFTAQTRNAKNVPSRFSFNEPARITTQAIETGLSQICVFVGKGVLLLFGTSL